MAFNCITGEAMWDVLLGTIEVVGSLGLFLFGMKVMGDGLQNAAGSKLQSLLGYMTANRFTAFLTGLIFTAVIQSSSATTVFVVSFVNAGLLQLTQAIGVILGANIGTTATAWLVSFLGFKFNIADLAIPAIGIGLPFMFLKGSRKNAGDVFIGFGILFLGIMFLKNSVPNPKDFPELLQSIGTLSHYGFASTLLFVLIGTVLTIVVQSSSAAMAITLTMAAAGWIDFPMSVAIILGENIGTTITAQLASIGANRNSRRAAMAHTMFNVIGVTWMLIFMPLFLNLVDFVIPGSPADPGNMPLHLSLFHTTFNLVNAFLFIWFVPAYAKLIERILPPLPQEQDQVYRLKYLSATLQDTPEVNYITVQNEVEKMSRKAEEMFSHFSRSLIAGKTKEAEASLERVKALETYLDQMQEEISKFIAACMQERPSEQSARNLAMLLKVVDDLESIGDSTERLGSILRRTRDKKIEFPSGNIEAITPFLQEVQKGLSHVSVCITKKLDEEAYLETKAIEDRIDSFRSNLKKAARKRIQAGGDVKMEILFIDILEELEKIGDYTLEIAKELRNIKE